MIKKKKALSLKIGFETKSLKERRKKMAKKEKIIVIVLLMLTVISVSYYFTPNLRAGDVCCWFMVQYEPDGPCKHDYASNCARCWVCYPI